MSQKRSVKFNLFFLLSSPLHCSTPLSPLLCPSLLHSSLPYATIIYSALIYFSLLSLLSSASALLYSTPLYSSLPYATILCPNLLYNASSFQRKKVEFNYFVFFNCYFAVKDQYLSWKCKAPNSPTNKHIYSLTPDSLTYSLTYSLT